MVREAAEGDPRRFRILGRNFDVVGGVVRFASQVNGRVGWSWSRGSVRSSETDLRGSVNGSVEVFPMFCRGIVVSSRSILHSYELH